MNVLDYAQLFINKLSQYPTLEQALKDYYSLVDCQIILDLE